MTINILSKEITQKIAAGEVVERPSSVVKELVENSIDAGAKNITVEINDGGISYIRVTDNGCGMNEEDSRLCFKTHATSKIKSEEDLFKIATLGFRGEAIPSICAVSKVTIYTRTADSDYGMKIVNHGGEIQEIEKSGRPEGTTIVAEELFYNVPARLKFLKKPSTEAMQISSIIQKYILARPDISFRFISAGKEVYFSNGDGSLKNAIHAIYGKEIYNALIPLEYAFENIRINGFIGDPTISRGTRNMQNLFVNGRFIRSEIISNSVKQGYLNRIMPAKYPFFVLNLTMPYEDIDVNVHPNKLDVRFKEEGIIQECFFKAVKNAFEAFARQEYIQQQPLFTNAPADENKPKEVITPVSDKKNERENNREVVNSLINKVNGFSNLFTNDDEKTNELKSPTGVLNRATAVSSDVVSLYNNEVVVTDTEVTKEPPKEKSQTELQMNLFEDISNYKVIGQVFNTYILVEYKDMLLFIDQHAAHERINTQLLLKEFEESAIKKQTLLSPMILTLTAEDFETVMETVDIFDRVGFKIEEFGQNVIRINTVPHIFGEENIEQFFLDTLDAIRKNPKTDARKHAIFDMACKHSIKAGQKLSDEQIKELISQSLADKTPLHCPHGRSVVIIKEKRELEKWFMRIV